jgi:hypothetical protein
MYIANVVVTINTFVAANYNKGQSPSCLATLSPPQDISPQPVPGTFTQKGNRIIVSVPPGYQGGVQLIYQLADKNYVLLGAMFRGPNGGAGRLEFNTITLQRWPTSSQMTVTDACLVADYKKVYDYTLIIQDVLSGNIGIIDPEEETDPTEPPMMAQASRPASAQAPTQQQLKR